jgi:hypothetical protein
MDLVQGERVRTRRIDHNGISSGRFAAKPKGARCDAAEKVDFRFELSKATEPFSGNEKDLIWTVFQLPSISELS